MTRVNEFVNKVLSTTESFMLEGTDRDLYFMQCNVGKGKYIYSEYSGECHNKQFSITSKPILVAIVSGDNVYMTDRSILYVYDKNDLPTHTYFLTDITTEKNKYIESVIFREFYDLLEEIPIKDEATILEYKHRARRELLGKNSKISELSMKDMFNNQDIVNYLCGFFTLEEEARRRLTIEKGRWITIKSRQKKIEELIKNHLVAEPYEIKIVEGIRSVNAKMLTVEFGLKGNKASAKISPETTIHKLIERQYFSEYDFSTRICGEKLLSELHAGSYPSKEKEVLTCNHITKIIYGKKTLYVKEE